MSWTQVLVQLDDDLLAQLDERAGAEGISRSELIRRAARAFVASDAEAVLDRTIADGYRRHSATPPPRPDLTASPELRRRSTRSRGSPG